MISGQRVEEVDLRSHMMVGVMRHFPWGTTSKSEWVKYLLHLVDVPWGFCLKSKPESSLGESCSLRGFGVALLLGYGVTVIIGSCV